MDEDDISFTEPEQAHVPLDQSQLMVLIHCFTTAACGAETAV